MSFSLTCETQPTAEPVTLAEAKAFLRVDHARDDAFLGLCITTARRKIEERTGQQLLTATWKLALDRFPVGPCEIVLPKPPLQSVTTLKYLDENGTLQTLAASEYIVSTGRMPARIQPAYGTSWPIIRRQLESVQVTYDAGYVTADEVQERLGHAILGCIHWLYFERGTNSDPTATMGLPRRIEAMLSNHIVGWLWP